jgi:Cyclin-dependent kinase inhibitor 3 (CDKN3)
MSVTTTYAQNLRALCSEENQHLWRVDTMETTKSTPLQPTKLQQQLLSVAASVREKIGPLSPPSAQELSFCSNFVQPDHQTRGFCNWLIPGHLMIGQYPGQNPLWDGPSATATAQHLHRVTTQANVSVFCSLQRETPAQDDSGWTPEGHCYLQPESIRRQLPLPFVQYAPLVREYCSSETSPLFLHAPIEDLSVPECQEPLQQLLLELLTLLQQGKTLYIHCWGGRGRAGLVGACLLALIGPHWTATTILNWIQRGYATRAGHERLAPEYASSPQTCPQREYVRAFVEQYQALYDQFETKQQPQKK